MGPGSAPDYANAFAGLARDDRWDLVASATPRPASRRRVPSSTRSVTFCCLSCAWRWQPRVARNGRGASPGARESPLR